MARPRTRPVRAPSRASVGIELIDAARFINELEKLVYTVQQKVIEDAISAGTRPVLAAMIANTPESTGSRDKQSAKTKRKWANSKKLKTTIRAVVRPKAKFGQVIGRIGLVGPSYSDGGGHGNFFAKDHDRQLLWGFNTGVGRVVNQFVKRASDESKAAATAAVISVLQSGIEAAAAKMAK